jgi:hypothetical protein
MPHTHICTYIWSFHLIWTLTRLLSGLSGVEWSWFDLILLYFIWFFFVQNGWLLHVACCMWHIACCRMWRYRKWCCVCSCAYVCICRNVCMHAWAIVIIIIVVVPAVAVAVAHVHVHVHVHVTITMVHMKDGDWERENNVSR